MEPLKPYQEAGAQILSSWRKHYLGDEPGLGKTRTALRAAQLVGAKTVHVVCPAIVRPHWWAEAKIICPEIHVGVWSYQRLVVSEFARWQARGGNSRPDVLIVDEAHFCKHRDSQRTKAIFGTGDGLAATTLAAGGRVWPLSGTPMPRNPAEMFPVFYSLWPKTLEQIGIRSYMDWLERFCVWSANRYGVKVYGAKNVDLLRDFLEKVLLRRTTALVAPELPDLRWGVITIDVPDIREVILAQAEIDPETRDALLRGELPPMSPQLARFRHQVGDLKAPAVAEMIRDELTDNTDKRVIFAYHRSVLDRLENDLSDLGVVRIDGSTSAQQREHRKRDFIDEPYFRVFLGQIGACATGMDGLQLAAHEAVMVEPDWATDLNVQAGHRIGRIGQSLPAQVRMIALNGTLDTSIVRNHEREVSMVADVLG